MKDCNRIMIDLSLFCFDRDFLSLISSDDFVASVPAQIGDQESLFRIFRQELQLPHYFGSNWDAFEECIRDLSWIKSRRIFLIHVDLPSLDTVAFRTYLEVLSDTVSDWKSDGDHELLVVFPPETYDVIVRILQDQ
jgi:RNAse (barnase) inhibitor barstar